MTLADYIDTNLTSLIEEFAQFAHENIPAAESMSGTELRDGAREMLEAFLADMRSAQSTGQGQARAKGLRPDLAPAVTHTAQEHARERFGSGFSLADLISEYRALRSNVSRRWLLDAGSTPSAAIELARLNDAIDQSLSEAAAWFNDETTRARNVFIGVLAHDLRDPLAVAVAANDILQMEQADSAARERAIVTSRKSLDRIRGMINYLLDFAHTSLGRKLPISPAAADMREVCEEIVEATRTSSPNHAIRLHCSGELFGEWDVDRIKQALSNLIQNAIYYGESDSDITVSARAAREGLQLAVHNRGSPIPESQQEVIFHPLRQAGERRRHHGGGLGLGLFVVEKVAEAHNGSVEVHSTEEDGTTFTLRLPTRVSGWSEPLVPKNREDR